jgi:hypothetical protein
MLIKVNKVHSGGRNLTLVFTGVIDKEDESKAICLVSKLDAGVKLSSVAFLVQEKAGFQLWWDEDLTEPMMPVESRGAFRFDGVRPPSDWKGEIFLVPFKVDEKKMFVLSLDFDK